MSGSVLVTGAAGKLGAALCQELQQQGWTVRALAHRRRPEWCDEMVRGSVCDRSAVERAAEGMDAVVHLAARTHARSAAGYRTVNVEGTANVVAAAGAGGVSRLLFVSSRAATPEAGAYGRSKLEAEALVARGRVDATVVRLPEVYGLNGREGVDDIIRRARRNAPIAVVGSSAAVVCPVHVDDVVPPLVKALGTSAAAGKTYTLAGDCLTVSELARRVVADVGSASRIVELPVWSLRLLGPVTRVVPLPMYPDQLARLLAPKPTDAGAAVRDLGFAPRSLDAALSALAGGRETGRTGAAR